MGGINSIIHDEDIPRNVPVSRAPVTFILGMDVSHGPPGQAYIPSIAAVIHPTEEYFWFTFVNTVKIEV